MNLEFLYHILMKKIELYGNHFLIKTQKILEII